MSTPLSSIKASAASCRRAFFDARPLGREPLVDRLRVPLSGDALGLLGSEATFPHPRGEIPRMETDGELLLDQMGQPRAGPMLGGEPMLRGFLRQPTPDDFLLGGREFSRSSRGRTSG